MVKIEAVREDAITSATDFVTKFINKKNSLRKRYVDELVKEAIASKAYQAELLLHLL